MKKILNNILILFSITTFLVSCEQDDYTVLNSEANTVVNIDVSEVVLLAENIDQDALKVSWTDTDYGYNAGSIVYQVTFTNTDQSKIIPSTEADLFKVFETTELNKILLGIGVVGDTPTPVDVTVTIVLSAYKSIEANTVTFTATTYEDQLDLSTIWGVVGSGAPNGWDGPDVPFYTTSDANVLVSYPTLIDGEIKFRTNNAWDLNYGDTGLDGTLDDGGDNIPVTAGMYKILMNIATLTYTMEPYTWGLVGSATENGWDGPDMPLEYDSFTDSWKAVVTLIEGEIKFRQNNAWDKAYGDLTLDGILDQENDNNIAVTAGNYIVTANFETLEYSLEQTDVWGAVGSATPNGWDGPDAQLNRDWQYDNVWYINGLNLVDGELKFRTNNAWGNDFGDANLDGVLDKDDGNNIVVTTGSYDIRIDFSNSDAPTYTLTAN